jgi:hypothetical protein
MHAYLNIRLQNDEYPDLKLYISELILDAQKYT